MRLATFLPELAAIGGVETHLAHLTRDLSDRGHAIDLQYERDGDLGPDFRSVCASVTQGPSVRFGLDVLSMPRRIVSRSLQAGRRNPDVVYANNLMEFVWAGLIRARAGAPTLCQLHETSVFSVPLLRAATATLCRGSNRFVVASRFMRAHWAARGVPEDRIEVVPLGVEVDAFGPGGPLQRERARQALGVPDDCYLILYLGRVAPGKGIEVLLEAWGEIVSRVDDARLLLVGPRASAETGATVPPVGLRPSPRCEWLPARRDVRGLLHACDVLVLPSVAEEGFGRVIIEAMASGRPAVASAVGGVPEILSGDWKRFLVTPGDPAALARKLIDLSQWRASEPGLEGACRRLAQTHYAAATMTDRLEALLHEVCPAA